MCLLSWRSGIGCWKMADRIDGEWLLPFVLRLLTRPVAPAAAQ